MNDWTTTPFADIENARAFVSDSGPLPIEQEGYTAFVVRPTRRTYVIVAQRTDGGPVLQRKITRQLYQRMIGRGRPIPAGVPRHDPDRQRQVGPWLPSDHQTPADVIAYYDHHTRGEFRIARQGEYIALQVGEDIYEYLFHDNTEARVLHYRKKAA